MFPREELTSRPQSFWRYREALGLPDDMPLISLGEVMTPLTKICFRGWNIEIKLESLLPTGSYKDRGVAVCLSQLLALGIRHVAEDSSGNAGASTAAYAAAAGIRADIYVPASASPVKIDQARIYGARCQLVEGTRTESAAEAQRPRASVCYVGHSWHPLFACGIKSLAYEIAEQGGWSLPDWVVVPAGGGSLVLGLIDGFNELLAARYIERLPRILVVQSAACAPIYHAWIRGDGKISVVEVGPTVAEGVALPKPARGDQLLRAIYDYRATMVAVDDEQILSCWRDMARSGIFIEPTSAVAVAGGWLARERGLLDPGANVSIVITGHGLKTSAKLLAARL
jgi:threonine synthase